MYFSVSTVFATLLALSSAASLEVPGTSPDRRNAMALEARGVNANRPVPTGACCVPATSLKEDVCSVNGQSGRCVPADVNNCDAALTCIEDSRLTCNPKVLERGRPKCRLSPGA
ncbi:hypothetical protein TD95_001786 [Thielaviopsis punctulata]|uniref:Extracellular membrane protein CFEM domain-containing protein n=1 Tax=Thielaviopsis punctulata TaxID=72032 RepID=A0A0F4ZKL7_9PEZI|nr:hypothetical protein TD95_001786 [Thielaviopsis punctulata]